MTLSGMESRIEPTTLRPLMLHFLPFLQSLPSPSLWGGAVWWGVRWRCDWHVTHVWSLTDISHVYKYYEQYTILRYEAETHLNTWQYIYSNISDFEIQVTEVCVRRYITHTHISPPESWLHEVVWYFFFFQNFVNRQFDMGFYKRSILVAARFCCVSIHVSQTQIHQQAFVWPFERQWRTQKCSLI